MTRTWFAFMLSVFVAAAALAQESPSGQVQIPLDVYQQLLAMSQAGTDPKAPVNVAVGNARVNVGVALSGPSATATVNATLTIEVFEDRWVLVPVLPAGSAVTGVTVDGQPAQLIAAPGGLAFSTNKKGTYTMVLSYRVDANGSEGGFVLGIPLPEAASTTLTASLPGAGLDVAVIPAAGVRTSATSGTTRIEATLPTTRGVQLSWRRPIANNASFSRASYSGTLQGNAVQWKGELQVELFSDESVTLALIPRQVTLTNLQVDGNDAPIVVDGKNFATVVRGRGVHRVSASFETPVLRSEGPPRVEVAVPRVPVSRFELTLPGQKELTAEPGAHASSRVRGGNTTAIVNVPLTNKVTLSWSESVPDVVRRELRANASIYHIIHAEEGVLFSRARVVYDVRRGETSRIVVALPAGVQVNQVVSPSGGVADWRVINTDDGDRLQVFLDRQLEGELAFDVLYDRSLDPEQATALPLVSATGVGRQRGMVALLSSRELTLEPVDEGEATRVGENQLPSDIREAIELTVAHTFKYSELPPAMTVSPSLPERVTARFDAEVDSLLSLGDVTLTASASISLFVKSGSLDALRLVLPDNANLLNLSAPSLRSHRASEDDDRVIELEFTQEMEGSFQVDLSYERILGEDENEIDNSTVRVEGADVEQGIVAVEASSAVEVTPARLEALTPIDVGELPRQLVLQTTNPILLAFKYARAEPAPSLVLRVTRHRVVDVQEAAIDSATYKTLVTRDGLSVTKASFVVRNQRKQFLRIELPDESEIWSVFVDGRAEKPAVADDESGSLLIKIMNRTEGFPVEITYARRMPSIRLVGAVRATLPRPDILVTDTRWDLFLPDGLDYGRSATNMDVIESDGNVTGVEMKEALGRLASDTTSPNIAGPLHISVPQAGIRFTFSKLYANQSEVQAFARIPYSSASGSAVGQLWSFVAAAMVWIGGFLLWTKDERLPRRGQVAFIVAGTIALAVAFGVYHVSSTPTLLLSLAVAGYLAAPRIKQLIRDARVSDTAQENG